MTKLTYIVGKEEIASYSQAKRRAVETGLPAIPKYTLMVKEQRTDPARFEKIRNHFSKMRAARAF